MTNLPPPQPAPYQRTARQLAGPCIRLTGRLMIEAFRRARGKMDGIEMACHGGNESDQAGYCLDAPQTMPAGACRSFEFDDDEDLPAFVEQVVCEREAA